MKYKLMGILLCLGMFVGSGCLKKEDNLYEQNAMRLQEDGGVIQDFIKRNNIPATRHESGIYYQVIVPGSGDMVYSANTQVEVKYTGRLLDGTVFDQTVGDETYKSRLGDLIDGWKIGIQLIQKGGKIRLLIPSVYGYRNKSLGKIPANAVLDFDIEIIDIN